MKKDIVRVKSGKISPETLVINTLKGEKEISWQDIEFMCLGIISEVIPSIHGPVPPIKKMVTNVLLGKGSEKEEKVKNIRTSYILDIFIKEKNEVLRFDSAYINYKSFLETIDYISLNNFKTLLKKISNLAAECVKDKCLCAFLDNQRDSLIYYKSLNDFEIESLQLKDKLIRSKDSEMPKTTE